MLLKYQYYHFKKVISVQNCQKIIKAGLDSMVANQLQGNPVIASTFSGKQASDKDSDKLRRTGEMTKEQMRKAGVDEDNTLVRDSRVSWLNDKWIYDLFRPLLNIANESAHWRWNIDFAENFQFTVYKGDNQNKGFYGWHTDGHSDIPHVYKPAIEVEPGKFKQGILDNNLNVLYDGKGNPKYTDKDVPMRPDGKQFAPTWTRDLNMCGKVRKISMTCNLTNPLNYEGGLLKFDFGHHMEKHRFKECTEIKEQGSVVFFPSFLPHCVTPVTKGTRYSLVLWSLGKPWQ